MAAAEDVGDGITKTSTTSMTKSKPIPQLWSDVLNPIELLIKPNCNAEATKYRRKKINGVYYPPPTMGCGLDVLHVLNEVDESFEDRFTETIIRYN